MVAKYIGLGSPGTHFMHMRVKASYAQEMEVRKNLTIFNVCQFPQFFILISQSSQKIELKNSNSDPCFFNLLKLGTISLAVHFLNCTNIGGSQTIEAVIRDPSKFILGRIL